MDHIKIFDEILEKATQNATSLGVGTRIILHFQAQRGPRHDTRFAIASMRNIKPYKPTYVVVYNAYDSENIRATINCEINSKDMISTKNVVKTGYFRNKSIYTFDKLTYSRQTMQKAYSV